MPIPVLAHVKWFSDFDYSDAPRTFAEILTPTFLSLTVLSAGVIGAMVFLDRRLDDVGLYGQINRWLSDRAAFSFAVMRIAMSAVLLISWENRALLTPELAEPAAWIGWMEFALAGLLLFPRSAPAAGIGVIMLWVIGLGEYGPFHMLDYLHYVGIGIYLFVAGSKNEKLRGLGLPALYLTVGFALIWLGLEKLVYPEWALYILEDNPQLLLGLPPDFFLQGAAFVEISLGFLLIIGLLERPLAAVITVVFLTTTLIFGRVEVVGHTPVHAALVVFLLNGPGTFYKPPIALHRRIPLRVSFAVVNFLLTVAILGFAYSGAAQLQFDRETTVSQMPMDASAPTMNSPSPDPD